MKFELEQGSEPKTLVLRSPTDRADQQVPHGKGGGGAAAGRHRDFRAATSRSPPDMEFVVNTLNLVDSDDADRIGVDILFSEPLDESRDYTGFITVSPEAEYEVEAADRILRLRGRVQPRYQLLSGGSVRSQQPQRCANRRLGA